MEELRKKNIIGILTMPLSTSKYSKKSLINSFYIDWIESLGAKVVPIPYNLPFEKLLEMLKQVNGLILQGGNCKMKWPYTPEKKIYKLNKHGFYPYECVVEFILQKVLNEELVKFPLLSICWNFELIPCILNGNREGMLDSSNSIKESFSLLKIDKSSQLFSPFTQDELNLVSNNLLTYHYHRYHISPSKIINNEKLSSFFKITSICKDKDGVEFVASYEHCKLPIFGLQFHPEKVGLNRSLKISSCNSAIEVNRKFGIVFIEECFKSEHSLKDINILLDRCSFVKQTVGVTTTVYVFNNDG